MAKMIGFDFEDDCEASTRECLKSFKPLNIDINNKKINFVE